MEESEKRRERLRAMRIEANTAIYDNKVQSSEMPPGLANPLIEASASPQLNMEPHGPPKFDYYTNPMAAFSANKRGSQINHQIPQGYQTPTTPSTLVNPLAHQDHMNYYPGHRVVTPQGPYRSPMRMASPFGMQPGTPPGIRHGPGSSPSYFSPPNISRVESFPSPGPSPSFYSGPGRGPQFQTSHGPGSGFRGRYGSNIGRSRGQWSHCEWRPGLKQSGGRGSGCLDYIPAEDRPDRYYNKSMIRDPWVDLKLVLLKRDNATTASTSDAAWVVDSARVKKAKVVSDAENKPCSAASSGPSLAEYLAASFHESINNADVSNDKPEEG